MRRGRRPSPDLRSPALQLSVSVLVWMNTKPGAPFRRPRQSSRDHRNQPAAIRVCWLKFTSQISISSFLHSPESPFRWAG
jgi:hypothetical protein